MQNIRIDDLSVIEQKKIDEDSILELGKTKVRNHIHCLHSNDLHYSCPICTRLRAVCPFSKEQRQHSQQFLNVRNSTFLHSKSNNSTMMGQRTKTYSTMQSGNKSRNQTLFVQSQHEPFRNIPKMASSMAEERVRYVQTPPRTQEIIFYPVIHNKVVQSPMRGNPQSTPTRRNKSHRFIDIQEDMILTPTQFKSLVESYRS